MSEKADRGRKLRDANDARAVLAQVAASGLSLPEYCAAQGINRWSLYHWRSKLTKQRLKKTPRAKKPRPARAQPLPSFAEVQLPARVARYTLRAPSGWTLECDNAFDPDQVAHLIEVLRRC